MNYLVMLFLTGIWTLSLKVPSGPIFKELGILKIDDIFSVTTLTFVYESLNKLNPEQFHAFYKFPYNTRNTTNNRNNNLELPIPRTTTYGLKSLKFVGCKLWNSLSTADRNSVSKNVFKKHIKDQIISKY